MSALHDGAVVVGVDESVFSGQALRWAADQARLEGRRLVLVNASGPVSAAWGKHGTDRAPGETQLHRRGRELLDRARASILSAGARQGAGVEIGEIFEVTDPRTLLVELSHTAHLVVLGSRGRGPVRSHLLGSVGLAVVRHAECPVVVVRPGPSGRVRRGVVVAVDATESSLPVLTFAFTQASLRQLPLKIVHYVYVARSALVGAPMGEVLTEGTEEHSLALSESLVGLREQFPDVHVVVETVQDVPEHGLAAFGDTADLLVVGSHHRGPVGRLLAGSVSGVVLEHAHSPVAVVPVAAPAEPVR